MPAPKQRNTEGEKAGKSAAEIWPDEPNKAFQKDTDARWTLKIGGKNRYRPDGQPLPQIATPVFGYKSHIHCPAGHCEAMSREGPSIAVFGFIRGCSVTSAAAPDGRELRKILSNENTSAQVWADTAYC